MDISELLAFSVKNKASDLHLSAGLPPMIRVHGDVRRINLPPLEHKDVHGMIYDIMNDAQRKQYDENLETDFSFDLPGLARFRVNAFNQDRGAAAVLRTIPSRVLSLEELQCPRQFRGLFAEAARAGAGDRADRLRQVDHAGGDGRPRQQQPLWPHPDDRGSDRVRARDAASRVINQREVGPHTLSFSERAAVGAARGPGRRAGRRVARPGNDPPGADRRRDGPPGVRHAAYLVGRQDHRPRRRRVPGGGKGNGAGHAVRVAWSP